MSFTLRPVDLDFLTTAPETFVFRAPVRAAREDVFAAISADPSTWTWFPGLSHGSYLSREPHGVGSIREIRMGGTTYRETMMAWDEPLVWTYRVDAASVPLAEALVEEWAILEGATDQDSIVRWTFAIEPKPLFRTGKVAASFVMGELFRKAIGNLSDHLSSAAAAATPRSQET